MPRRPLVVATFAVLALAVAGCGVGGAGGGGSGARQIGLGTGQPPVSTDGLRLYAALTSDLDWCGCGGGLNPPENAIEIVDLATMTSRGTIPVHAGVLRALA